MVRWNLNVPLVKSLGHGAAEIWEPPETLSFSAFAAKYRKLHAVYCSERPGLWDATVFPCQAPIMDCIQEAIVKGKRGLVMMKPGQSGGTDIAINAMCALKVYYPGPQLFLTSTEDVAGEFGRERFALIIPDMPPLLKRYLPNPRGDILCKRFMDGKIQLAGGQSIFKLQSTPYRIVCIDELDSLVDNLGGSGDPVKLAEVRMDSFTGRTLMIAYAHPSTRDRGAGKLYYESSDQRRGFVKHACGGEFWLQWEHVRIIPGKDQTQEQAAVDPDCYSYVCPQCGAEIYDAERVVMARAVKYRSTLAPEIAAKKAWIGVHYSQLYSPGKSIRSLAQRRIECGKDENAIRVFANKVLGEPYESKISKIEVAALRQLIVVKRRANDPEFYTRGQVPPGVRFLTAGQDSRTTQLHYCVWGWGLRRAMDRTLYLCGWLIDWGIIARPYALTFTEAEYHAFDDVIYRRAFVSTNGQRSFHVRQCGHDVGYPPTQIAIATYCRNFPARAIPVKGASETHSSAVNASYARWGNPLAFKAGEQTVKDEHSRHLQLNTHLIKSDWYSWTNSERKIIVPDANGGPHPVNRLTLPEDVDEEWLKQSASESLGVGKKTTELVWRKDGPNHFADCNTYALGLAYNLDPFQGKMTDDEAQNEAVRPVIREPPPEPAMEDYARY